ncbi:MFS transporter [Streptomyces iakyrus]|uniref:MFS transporter n=1 Tax=Streptomyces iakyrus TaxID=68219 RepID=UPI0033C32375
MGPAWQAIQPEPVERDMPGEAAALGAVNMNLARALGPALGGAVVAAAGAGWVFAFNAVSYLGIAAALLFWRRPRPQAPTAGNESVLTALGVGRRYVCNAPGVRRILLRTVLFIPGGAALWSLLPLVVSAPWVVPSSCRPCDAPSVRAAHSPPVPSCSRRCWSSGRRCRFPG